MVPGRNKLLVSAARMFARELGKAKSTSAGSITAVPAKGLAGGARRGRVAGAIVNYGFWLSLVASGLAFFLTAPSATRLGTTKSLLELAVGLVLSVEGLLLVFNWHGARWRFVQRRIGRQGGAGGMLSAFRWRLFGYGLFALGLVWVGVGVVYLGQGASDLF